MYYMPLTFFFHVVYVLHAADVLLPHCVCITCCWRSSSTLCMFYMLLTFFFHVVYVLHAVDVLLSRCVCITCCWRSSSTLCMYYMPLTFFHVVYVLHAVDVLLLHCVCIACRWHSSSMLCMYYWPLTFFFHVVYVLHAADVLPRCTCITCRWYCSIMPLPWCYMYYIWFFNNGKGEENRRVFCPLYTFGFTNFNSRYWKVFAIIMAGDLQIKTFKDNWRVWYYSPSLTNTISHVINSNLGCQIIILQ